MAATAMKEAITPFIPSDIMANIFKRLPPRSLTRFRSVNKDWENLIKNLIKTPSFVQDHLHYSGHRNPSLLLEQHQDKFRRTGLTVLDHDMRACKVQKLPLKFNCEVVGSCNGLVCIKMVEKGIYPHPVLIWNPVTGEVRKVPPRTVIDYILYDYLGFGFNPLDNDYKVVRIIACYNIKAVEVYSLNSGSWKEVDVKDNLKSISINSLTKNITINGVMFFDAGWALAEHRILSVDLSTKVCTIILTPLIYSLDPRCLVEYENKPAVVACIEDRYGCNSIHLWVMEEYTNTSSDSKDSEGWEWDWTKIYPGRPYRYQHLYPLTVTWTNEIVFLLPSDQTENNDGRTTFLHLLNVKTDVFRRVAVGCHPCNYGQTRKGTLYYDNDREIEIDIFNYVESFVSVHGMNIEEL